MARWGSALIGVGMVLGAVLIAIKGMTVLLFGLAGIALATLYSIPPVQLSARGWGEAAVGIGFGVLPVCGVLSRHDICLYRDTAGVKICIWVWSTQHR